MKRLRIGMGKTLVLAMLALGGATVGIHTVQAHDRDDCEAPINDWKPRDAVRAMAQQKGWQVDKLSVEMTEPRYMPLIAYPDAWSPQTAGVVSGRVVYVGDKTTAQVHAMRAQLRDAILAKLTRGGVEVLLDKLLSPG